ncbi:hypothetical protein JCM3775_002733 [Rhodotorula graminis]
MSNTTPNTAQSPAGTNGGNSAATTQQTLGLPVYNGLRLETYFLFIYGEDVIHHAMDTGDLAEIDEEDREMFKRWLNGEYDEVDV